MKQKNNHARSKQKRKQLRLKNRIKSILKKRVSKTQKNLKEKSKPFKSYVNADGKLVGAKDVAIMVSH